MTLTLIADATHATFYREHHDGSMDVIQTVEHPSGRARCHDLVSDRPGRAAKGPGARRFAFQAPTDPVDVDQDHFVKEIVGVLEAAVASGGYQEVVLVAPPRLLGRLRKHLPDAVSRHVVDSLALDLGRKGLAGIPAALRAAREARAAHHPEIVPPVLHPSATEWLPSSPR